VAEQYAGPGDQRPAYDQESGANAAQSQQYPQPQQYGQPQQYPAHPQQAPYGAAPQPGYGYPGTVVLQQAPSNGLGTAGFVTGLLGLIFCWIPVLGIILGVLGVILGGVGISNGKKKGAGTGLAIAGLVLGLISLIPSIIIIAAVSSAN
jgi:hypothetical protein